jgi:hypothetical protein
MKKLMVIDDDAFARDPMKKQEFERDLRAAGYLVMFVKPGSRVMVHDLADLKPRPAKKMPARKRRARSAGE